MEWSDASIAKLRSLWAEGHSTAEIGRRMGISKNSVVNKANRINLSRPSPIDWSGKTTRRSQPRRAPKQTLEELAAIKAPAPVTPPPAGLSPVVAKVIAVQHERHHASEEPARRIGVQTPCCWPLGEPGTREFRFCEANAVANKPYCVEHVAQAYARIPELRRGEPR